MNSDYMTEDQRFASTRPDVLVYRGAALDDDLTIARPVKVNLTVSTSGTDSDFIVKLVDVYPGDYPEADPPKDAKGRPVPQPSNTVRMSSYQQLVKGEPFRAKFRNGFETPVAMTPGEPATSPSSCRTCTTVFRRGHRVMVQVQSSVVPALIDRNPRDVRRDPQGRRRPRIRRPLNAYYAAVRADRRSHCRYSHRRSPVSRPVGANGRRARFAAVLPEIAAARASGVPREDSIQRRCSARLERVT